MKLSSWLNKAVLSAALLLSELTLAGEMALQIDDLSIKSSNQQGHVQLMFVSESHLAYLTVQSSAGNRMSTTLNKGTRVSYRLNITQFPITVFYETDNSESEFMINCNDTCFVVRK